MKKALKQKLQEVCPSIIVRDPTSSSFTFMDAAESSKKIECTWEDLRERNVDYVSFRHTCESFKIWLDMSFDTSGDNIYEPGFEMRQSIADALGLEISYIHYTLEMDKARKEIIVVRILKNIVETRFGLQESKSSKSCLNSIFSCLPSCGEEKDASEYVLQLAPLQAKMN